MKTVISDKKLREKMKIAVNLICDAVGSTLGPSGNNVLINEDDKAPYITNDGVTIANSINSEDVTIDTILEIIKEASLKTDEKVGDGTTTTLVLLKSIFNEGLKQVEKGINPVYLKRELEISKEEVLNRIESLKISPSEEDIKKVAIVSSEDRKIGNIVFDVYSKLETKNAIRIEESKDDNTYYEIKRGYSIDADVSSLYFKDSEYISLKNVYVITIRGYLDSFESFADIINDAIENDRSIIIFAHDFDETLENEVILYFLQSHKRIFLFKIPDYAKRQDIILEDISAISNSNIINLNYQSVLFNDLGLVNKVLIKENEIIIVGDNNVENRISKLTLELTKLDSDYDKEFINTSIAKLTKGLATIYVGGITKVEKKEKIMRCYDALNAIEEAKKGVIVGEGITYLKVANVLEDSIGNNIMKKALLMPFIKIMENSGLNSDILKDIINSNYEKIYNIESNRLDNIEKYNIVDPVSVAKEAINNATSIAIMLLTTNYLVINEKIKEKEIL